MRLAALILSLAMAVSGALAGAAPVASAQTLKLGTLAPEGSVWHTVLRDMGDAWAEVSNGQVRLRIYPGGVAGDDADMVRKMRIGQLQASGLTGGGLATIAADLGIFQMPMLLKSDGELDYVRAHLHDQLATLLDEKGFKLLYWSDIGWVYLFSKTPVRGPDELRPLKIWVWSGDAAWADALRSAGYRPVPLPATEIHTGLQSGLVDTFSTTPVAALSMQWFALAPNMAAMKWAPLTAAVVVSKRAWDRIPEALKPQLIAASDTARADAEVRVRALEEQAVESMKKYGLTVHDIAPEVAADWSTEVEQAYPTLIGKSVPEDIYNQVRALLDEYRAAQAKPSAGN